MSKTVHSSPLAGPQHFQLNEFQFSEGEPSKELLNISLPPSLSYIGTNPELRSNSHCSQLLL